MAEDLKRLFEPIYWPPGRAFVTTQDMLVELPDGRLRQQHAAGAKFTYEQALELGYIRKEHPVDYETKEQRPQAPKAEVLAVESKESPKREIPKIVVGPTVTKKT